MEVPNEEATGAAARVEAAWRTDARTSDFADQLAVRCRQGAIELQGRADDVSQRCRAGRVATLASGGVPVENRIEVVPYPPREDGEIRRHVEDAFQQDPNIEGRRITVTVTDGKVRLEGSCDSRITLGLITVTTWWIPGVRAVANQLDVIHPEEGDDWITLETLPVIFDRDWLLGGSNIMFSCKNGVVKLTGIVPGPEVRRAVENDVWVLDGVSEVINDLQVEPCERLTA